MIKSRLFGSVTSVLAWLAIATNADAAMLAAEMASAYANSPALNSARAALRATDEGVPQALANRRPGVSASANYGRSAAPGEFPSDNLSISISIEQAIYDGNRTRNGILAAETAVLAGRESLRASEQDLLLDVVTAYMNLVRDQALVGVSAQNLEFLGEQLRAARNRRDVGEGTQTEVAQIEAQEAAARADYAADVANQTASRAVYEQVIGHPASGVTTAPPLSSLLPRSAEAAADLAVSNHPDVQTAVYNVETASLNVLVAEGAMLPTVSVSAGASRSVDPFRADEPQVGAEIGARFSVPIFTGGQNSSEVREAKERLGQREIDLIVVRNQLRADAITAFGDYESARAQIVAAEASVAASQLALEGIIQERDVGQATSLDVLDAQQDLLDARTTLIQAQRNRVVASYALLAAAGGLSATDLGLGVQLYDPAAHYVAVRDRLWGTTTPDGR